MDYGRSELADRLGAEYAAGLLRGGARRRLEALLPAHPTLKAAVDAWRDRLMPLTQAVAPVEPSPGLWSKIEARLGGPGIAGAATSGRFADGGVAGVGAGASADGATRARGPVGSAGGRGDAGRALGAWWRGVAFWRIATGFSGIAALLLALQVASPPPV